MNKKQLELILKHLSEVEETLFVLRDKQRNIEIAISDYEKIKREKYLKLLDMFDVDGIK